jgi:hypothetical protein
VFVDRALNSALSIGGWVVEVSFEAAGDIYIRVVEAAKEEFLDSGVVKANAELPVQLAGHLNDLSGVAHRRILHRNSQSNR